MGNLCLFISIDTLIGWWWIASGDLIGKHSNDQVTYWSFIWMEYHRWPVWDRGKGNELVYPKQIIVVYLTLVVDILKLMIRFGFGEESATYPRGIKNKTIFDRNKNKNNRIFLLILMLFTLHSLCKTLKHTWKINDMKE